MNLYMGSSVYITQTPCDVPDVLWLQNQANVFVIQKRLRPGQLMVVNNGTMHNVVNVGNVTTSMAWNTLPPSLLQTAWHQMHQNRQCKVPSKILLQELVYRAHKQDIAESQACWEDLLDAQRFVFENRVFFHQSIQEEQLTEFYWCDMWW